MQRKFLEELGIDKDTIDKIMTENGRDIESAKQKLTAERDGLQSQLTAAQDTLKGFDGVNLDDMNAKLTAATQQVEQLQAALSAERASAAVKLGLVEAKALDVDYLTYKLGEQLRADGKTPELDDSGKVKDWDTLLDGLRKQFPTQFEGGGAKQIQEHRLPEGDAGTEAEPATLADALKAQYEQTE